MSYKERITLLCKRLLVLDLLSEVVFQKNLYNYFTIALGTW